MFLNGNDYEAYSAAPAAIDLAGNSGVTKHAARSNPGRYTMRDYPREGIERIEAAYRR